MEEAEAGLSGRAVEPGGRYFGDGAAGEVGFDDDFHAELEAAGAFDGGLVEQGLAVELEAVSDVMGGDAG